MPPNVLLLVLDTARADAFEPYGAVAGASPTIGQLARRGAAQPTVIAPCNWTMPSHASLFTGLLPRTLGLAQAPGGKPANCRPLVEAQRHRFLPEVLRAHGYATRGISTNLWISSQTGFATGFDDFTELVGERHLEIGRRGARGRLSWALEALRAKADDGAAEAETVVERWLDEGPLQPFFWFVNLVECHSPFLPPKPWNDLGPIQRIKAGEDNRRHLTLGEIWRACAGGYDIGEDAIERFRHLYARSIRQLDDWLARVLDRLDRRGVLDDTLVLVTSDHGENLGECELIGHAFSIDNRLIHVPFVSAGPGAFSPDGPMGLADVPMLLARALDLDDHPWQEPDVDADGLAVAQVDALVAPDDPRAWEAVRTWGLGEDAHRIVTTSSTCATDGRLKLVRRGDDDLLYDLEADPLETTPVPPTAEHLDASVLARLRKAVDAADDPARAALPYEGPDVHDDRADLEERMRLLGYL